MPQLLRLKDNLVRIGVYLTPGNVLNLASVNSVTQCLNLFGAKAFMKCYDLDYAFHIARQLILVTLAIWHRFHSFRKLPVPPSPQSFYKIAK